MNLRKTCKWKDDGKNIVMIYEETFFSRAARLKLYLGPTPALELVRILKQLTAQRFLCQLAEDAKEVYQYVTRIHPEQRKLKVNFDRKRNELGR